MGPPRIERCRHRLGRGVRLWIGQKGPMAHGPVELGVADPTAFSAFPYEREFQIDPRAPTERVLHHAPRISTSDFKTTIAFHCDKAVARMRRPREGSKQAVRSAIKSCLVGIVLCSAVLQEARATPGVARSRYLNFYHGTGESNPMFSNSTLALMRGCPAGEICALVSWGDHTYGEGSTTAPSLVSVYPRSVDIGDLSARAPTPRLISFVPKGSPRFTDPASLSGGDSNLAFAAVPTPNSAQVLGVGANYRAFCAFKTDGSLACWGHQSYGGTPPSSVTSSAHQNFVRATSIAGNGRAFALLREVCLSR